MVRKLRLGPQGRFVITADLRKELGIRPGDDLALWVEGGRLVITSRRAVMEEIWEMFADVEEDLVAELIQERRREAAREP